jgi:hypothetical protein
MKSYHFVGINKIRASICKLVTPMVYLQNPVNLDYVFLMSLT